MTGDGSPSGVRDGVAAVLEAGPGAVVLDNFETLWSADPVPAEELLRWLAAIPQLGVAVTARGTNRPAGVRWRDFPVLWPLPPADARRLFLAVTGSGLADDALLDGLLAGLDGVPLALELMGCAAQNERDLGEVVARWEAERTGMLARLGGGRRELSVAVSVEASVSSPLMTPDGRRLLSLLGVLPPPSAGRWSGWRGWTRWVVNGPAGGRRPAGHGPASGGPTSSSPCGPNSSSASGEVRHHVGGQ